MMQKILLPKKRRQKNEKGADKLGLRENIIF